MIHILTNIPDQILFNALFLISFKDVVLMLLNIIKKTRYNNDKIIIEEIKAIILELLYAKNKANSIREANDDKTAAIRGLKIQLEISNTMQETFRSLSKYNNVFKTVVKKSAKM